MNGACPSSSLPNDSSPYLSLLSKFSPKLYAGIVFIHSNNPLHPIIPYSIFSVVFLVFSPFFIFFIPIITGIQLFHAFITFYLIIKSSQHKWLFTQTGLFFVIINYSITIAVIPVIGSYFYSHYMTNWLSVLGIFFGCFGIAENHSSYRLIPFFLILLTSMPSLQTLTISDFSFAIVVDLMLGFQYVVIMLLSLTHIFFNFGNILRRTQVYSDYSRFLLDNNFPIQWANQMYNSHLVQRYHSTLLSRLGLYLPFGKVLKPLTEFPEAIICLLQINPKTVIDEMNLVCSGSFDSVVTIADKIALQYQVIRIKVIGQRQIFFTLGISGPKKSNSENFENILAFSKLLSKHLHHQVLHPSSFSLSFCISQGPVVAGVLSSKRTCFEVFGPSIDLATEMSVSSLVHYTPGDICLVTKSSQSILDSLSETYSSFGMHSFSGFEKPIELFSVEIPRNPFPTFTTSLLTPTGILSFNPRSIKDSSSHPNEKSIDFSLKFFRNILFVPVFFSLISVLSFFFFDLFSIHPFLIIFWTSNLAFSIFIGLSCFYLVQKNISNPFYYSILIVLAILEAQITSIIPNLYTGVSSTYGSTQVAFVYLYLLLTTRPVKTQLFYFLAPLFNVICVVLIRYYHDPIFPNLKFPSHIFALISFLILFFAFFQFLDFIKRSECLVKDLSYNLLDSLYPSTILSTLETPPAESQMKNVFQSLLTKNPSSQTTPILFFQIVDPSKNLGPLSTMIDHLNQLFSNFDDAVSNSECEKLFSCGGEYVVSPQSLFSPEIVRSSFSSLSSSSNIRGEEESGNWSSSSSALDEEPCPSSDQPPSCDSSHDSFSQSDPENPKTSVQDTPASMDLLSDISLGSMTHLPIESTTSLTSDFSLSVHDTTAPSSNASAETTHIPQKHQLPFSVSPQTSDPIQTHFSIPSSTINNISKYEVTLSKLRGLISLAFDFASLVGQFNKVNNLGLDFRASILSGSIYGGFIGQTPLSFHYWGSVIRTSRQINPYLPLNSISIAPSLFTKGIRSEPLFEASTVRKHWDSSEKTNKKFFFYKNLDIHLFDQDFHLVEISVTNSPNLSNSSI